MSPRLLGSNLGRALTIPSCPGLDVRARLKPQGLLRFISGCARSPRRTLRPDGCAGLDPQNPSPPSGGPPDDHSGASASPLPDDVRKQLCLASAVLKVAFRVLVVESNGGSVAWHHVACPTPRSTPRTPPPVLTLGFAGSGRFCALVDKNSSFALTAHYPPGRVAPPPPEVRQVVFPPPPPPPPRNTPGILLRMAVGQAKAAATDLVQLRRMRPNLRNVGNVLQQPPPPYIPDPPRCPAATREEGRDLPPAPPLSRGRISIETLTDTLVDYRNPFEHICGIGCDPGVRELLVAVRLQGGKRCTTRLTLAQRYHQLCSTLLGERTRAEKTKVVLDSELRMRQHSRRLHSLAGMVDYATARAEHGEPLLLHAEREYRGKDRDGNTWARPRLQGPERRRKANIKSQQSISSLVKGLRALRVAGDRRAMVLFIGNWILRGGRTMLQPGQIGVRGNRSALSKGLLVKLQREFTVCIVNECYSTKRCYECRLLGNPRGLHRATGKPAETLEFKGKEKAEKAKREVEKRAGSKSPSRPHVRGLRRCDLCHKCFSRDINGAMNIDIQAKALLDRRPDMVFTLPRERDDAYDERAAQVDALEFVDDDEEHAG